MNFGKPLIRHLGILELLHTPVESQKETQENWSQNAK